MKLGSSSSLCVVCFAILISNHVCSIQCLSVLFRNTSFGWCQKLDFESCSKTQQSMRCVLMWFCTFWVDPGSSQFWDQFSPVFHEASSLIWMMHYQSIISCRFSQGAEAMYLIFGLIWRRWIKATNHVLGLKLESNASVFPFDALLVHNIL